MKVYLQRAASAALALFALLLITAGPVLSGSPPEDRFRQLDEILPSPNTYRNAAGAPGHQYWQQEADYVIDVALDDEKQRITGSETITYKNNSPDSLRYLWLQLDGNIFALDSHADSTESVPQDDFAMTYSSLRRNLARTEFDGRFEIAAVKDAVGESLRHTVVQTMMRVDLPRPLASGASVTFSVDWSYAINDSDAIGARTGFERFDDGNIIYEIAQWFPRMAAYTDYAGWQHKQFLGRGEFTLEFGDYLVRITAPDDHIVASTGVLQNPEEVLTDAQRERLAAAKTAEKPVFIVTPEEAKAAEKGKPTGTKTWVYKAEDVRDFAWASSRKFIWDAQGHSVEGNDVLAMSYYPNEGEPLWSRYSTHAIIHTLDVYSRYTFEYPYPIAISVNGPVGGMEYPMICFNGPRPEEDGTYSERTKYGLISVIIHEVGHNYFPMLVNSDERQWTWMDEGLNTFCQFLAEQEWEEDYPSRRGEPQHIVDYMKRPDQVPIMTNSESILQFGNNAYAKPATALNILRETVLGRELFDFAFKEYARRWQYKRPEPADFFRTMEDASGVDLDWFWRGWFYSTDHTDIAIERLRLFRLDSRDPEVEKAHAKKKREEEPLTLSKKLNAPLPKRSDRFPELLDFYNEFDELDVTPQDREAYAKLIQELEPEEQELLTVTHNFYVVDLVNEGGLVMPVILEVTYDDGSVEELRVPAEIWRRDPKRVGKLIMTRKKIARIVLDPHLETADTDLTDNVWPAEPVEGTFQLERWREKKKNPMQLEIEAKKSEQEKAEEAAKKENASSDDRTDEQIPDKGTDGGAGGKQ